LSGWPNRNFLSYKITPDRWQGREEKSNVMEGKVAGGKLDYKEKKREKIGANV